MFASAAKCGGHRRRCTALLGLLALFAALLVAIDATPAHAAPDTVSGDNLRTAWYSDEPGLSAANVLSSDFGQLFSTPVDGQVYGQPILANGTLIAATEADSIYGLDPVTGAVRWHRNVGKAWSSAVIGCANIVPTVGITSTPVYDPATNSVFFFAKVDDGVDAAHPHWYVHSVNPATGAERPGWPLTLQGSPANDPAHAFNPETSAQRPGLLLLDGVVYAGFASHCDYGPYVGYVVGVKTTTPAISTIWSTEAGSSFAEAGIWQSGGGLVSDGPGRIIVTTGNGVSPAPGSGDSPPSTLGESVVRLQVNADGSLTPASFFSPANNAALDQDDADLGSGSPMELPASFGTAAHPRLVVQAGKDGRVFLLDADHLGGSAQGPGGTDLAVSQTGPFAGVWGGPAFYGGSGGYVYLVGSDSYLRALRYSVDSSGTPSLASVGTSAATLAYGSGSPTVTSNGTSDPLVWVVSDPGPGLIGSLNAYDAVPTNGVLKLRYTAPLGRRATKFSRIAVADGRLYMGSKDGVLGFGRPTTSPLTGTPTDFGSVAVGSSANANVKVTAARALTINAVTTNAPFAVTPLSAPVTLAAGDTYTVPMTFAPTGPGAFSDTLSFDTSAGTAGLGVQGRGTQPGLAADPTPLDFGTVPTGSARNLTVSISNTGTDTETITAVTAPGAPFSSSALPVVGTTIPPGGSLAVPMTFQPATVGDFSDALQVESDAGSVSVPIAGTAVTGVGKLVDTPNPLDFGPLPIGLTATLTFDVTNAGNLGITITKAAAPTGVFNAPNPMPEGQFLAPGDTIHQTITFTPTVPGSVSAQYLITSNDGNGPQNVTITGTGVDDPIGAKYSKLADAGIRLGNPIGGEKSITGGKYQDFTQGSIYWSASTGAHYVSGALRAKYRALGGPTGVLGFPTTDQVSLANGGAYNDFAKGGSIYYSTATGAHEVLGTIRTKWRALGAQKSFLGYPKTDRTPTASHTGNYNDFTGGSIYSSPKTGPHETHGAIRTKWLSLGAERSKYGYPTTDIVPISGGSKQTFQHGTLTLKSGKVT